MRPLLAKIHQTLSDAGEAYRVVVVNDPPTTPAVEIGPVRPDEVPAVAALHVDYFGAGDDRGASLAKLGPDFLERAFYRPNLDNPHFHCDVARVDGRVVAFSVYSTDRQRVFRWTVRRRFAQLTVACCRTIARRPRTVASLAVNAAFVRGETESAIEGVSGWWIVAYVRPECRTREFKHRTGGRIAERMVDRMEGEFARRGCPSWYGVVHPDNRAINRFLQRRGARTVGHASSQGMRMRYYVKQLVNRAN